MIMMLPWFEQIENEENVLVCLRIIIELHKQFRPPLQSDVQFTLIYSMYFETVENSVCVEHVLTKPLSKVLIFVQ